MSEQPHDKLFKSTFSQIEHARGFLKTSLPAEISQHIDWKSLKLQPGSFVDNHLKEFHSDLLYSVKTEEKETMIYVLVEHKSTEDPWVMFQMLRYQVEIWTQWRKDNPRKKSLPPIIPLLVYHGEKKWKISQQFSDLFEKPPVWLFSYLPRFEYLLKDLTQSSSYEIQTQVGMNALCRFVLFLLKSIRYSEEWVFELPKWKKEIEQIAALTESTDQILQLFFYIFQEGKITTQKKKELLHFIELELGDNMKEKVMTMAELLKAEGKELGKAEGKELGKAEGKELGKAEGRIEGKAKTVQKQLQLKFGDQVTEADFEKVMQASETNLDRITELVLTDTELHDILNF